jgi:Periplasmic copper-binding protein (NosD)
MATIKIAPLLIAAMIVKTVALAAQPLAADTPLMRTYVSGTGSDSNPCSAANPCLTLQGALALTVAGGEIFVLDSANYGPVTINKAVTITSEGAAAGVLATSGAGITISASATDVVNLRGLDIDGSNSGSVGIQFNSGQSLNIQKSVVHSFTGSGINFAPNGASFLFVADTTLINNAGYGIALTNNATCVVSRVTATENGVGIVAYGSGVSLTVTDSLAGHNTFGIGSSSSAVMVRNSTFNGNSVGILADQSAIIWVGQSTIAANSTGLQTSNSGQVVSFGNNILIGNTTNGTATTTVALE